MIVVGFPVYLIEELSKLDRAPVLAMFGGGVAGLWFWAWLALRNTKTSLRRGWSVSPDIEVACPRCTYNLRGNESNRCPECGLDYVPEELARTIQAEPFPITCWHPFGLSPIVGGLIAATIIGMILA